VLSLYLPGSGPWHHFPAAPKALTVAATVLGVSLLPATWWGAIVAAVVALACYAIPGLGLRQLLRQVSALRWLAAFTAAGQLLFLGPEPAVVNTVRVISVIVIAAVLTLTTPVTDLLDAFERLISPLALVRVDPRRVALMLTVTLTMLPVLARLASDVRDAQKARGCRPRLHLFTVPFLIAALKHADDLGDALTARGVR